MRCLKALLRQKLVHHDAARYDGYRLTPLGYDFLALKALLARGAITAVGRQIGVGKESDVFEVSLQISSSPWTPPSSLRGNCLYNMHKSSAGWHHHLKSNHPKEHRRKGQFYVSEAAELSGCVGMGAGAECGG